MRADRKRIAGHLVDDSHQAGFGEVAIVPADVLGIERHHNLKKIAEADGDIADKKVLFLGDPVKSPNLKSPRRAINFDSNALVGKEEAVLLLAKIDCLFVVLEKSR